MRALPLALLVLPLSGADESIVLPPAGAKGSLPQKMLVFVPGGAVPNGNYAATARAIQAGSQLNLWVVIPAVFQRLCIISCSAPSLCAPLHATVEGVLAMAEAQGWKRGKDDEDIWLAGHSLGGICANTLFQAYSSGSGSPYAGIMVFGSYVDESGAHDLTHYPKPVLTLNAELDAGLARPGKTAVWWRQYLDLEASRGEEYALAHKAVIILPKMNHSDFCPGFNVPGDLMAEMGQAEATATIGGVVGAFLDAHASGPASPARSSALDLLKEKVIWTRDFLAPYLKAQEMERLVADTRVSSEGASPFCAAAQHVIAGLSDEDDKRLAVLDGFHITPADLEHCHPNWTVASDGLSVHSCSHTDYYADFDNTGSLTAASQIACKLLTSARISEQLNTTVARPQLDCQEVNKYAVQWAESIAAPSTLERYKRSGRGWCFLDDEPVAGNIGPLWVFKASLKLEANATCMAVASPALKTELDGPVYPGSHYCKLLSPARVLDWMMSDSLKPATSFTVEQGRAVEMLV